MAKMTNSELKGMIKKIVRECIREIIAEQVVGAPVLESLMQRSSQAAGSAGQREHAIINPYDTPANVLLRRQANTNKTQMIENSNVSQPDYENNSGYENPSDRLRLIDTAYKSRFNPALDASLNDKGRSQTRMPATVQNESIAIPMKMQNDDMMRSIFEHTAQTTFQEQLIAERNKTASPPADRAAAIVAQSNPDELFTNSQNWALLAFSSK